MKFNLTPKESSENNNNNNNIQTNIESSFEIEKLTNIDNYILISNYQCWVVLHFYEEPLISVLSCFWNCSILPPNKTLTSNFNFDPEN